MSLRTVHRGRRPAGFTLLELMAAVIVVGILATLALPSYRAYVLRANRAVVRTLLIDLAAKLEVEALRTGSYPDSFDFYLSHPGGGLRGEHEFFITSSGTVVGDVEDAGYASTIYGIRLRVPDVAAGEAIRDYTLTARAMHAQRDDAACQQFSVAASGLRSASPGRSDECWSR